MANDTFTLNIRERTVDGIKPTRVSVEVYPLANESGTPVKIVKDTAGNTVMSGHVKHRAEGNDAEITAGLVQIVLPDPRDTANLDPSGFGFEVRVKTNYFSHTETFGPVELDEFEASGVLELKDVTQVDGVSFEAAYIERRDALLDFFVSIGIDTDGTPYFDPGNIPIGSAATVQADTDGVPFFAAIGA